MAKNIERLKKYKEKKQYCNVSRKDDDKVLYTFVQNYQRHYKNNTPSLTEERKKQLEAINFQWKPR